MTCGIYKLEAPSGNFYIGSSIRVEARLKRHESNGLRGIHVNPKLQNAYNRYGALAKSILIVCRPDDLLMYEQLCIDGLRPKYNCAPVAGSTRGYFPSAETRAKMSRAHKGQKHSDETRAKMRDAQKGRTRAPLSAEHRAKIGAASAGRTHSLEVREKIAASKVGRPRSEETKAKLRAANLGKRYGPRSEETKAKMRAARARQSPPTLGMKHTEESRRKMSEAQKRKRAEQRRAVKAS